MKRSLAILFALLLTLSTAPAVFAEDTGEAAPAEGQETIIEETVSEDAEPIVPEEETEILLIEEEADVLLADGTGDGTGAEETPTEEPVEEDRPTIPEETVGCTADAVTDGKLLNNADNIFGTEPWDDNKDTTFDKAFDGDILTFYDAYNATIDAHVGMNVGTATQLTEVHIVPRNANGYDPEVEVLYGSGGVEYEDGNEFHNNLFDRDINSGWCQELTDEISEYYVIWKTSRPMEVLGYNLYTFYDTAEYPERNPIGWTLYGSVDGDEWIVIDEQDDNYDLPPENAALYSVYCPVETTGENQEPREAKVVGYWYNAIENGVLKVPETIEGYDDGTHTVVAIETNGLHRDNGINEARWFVEEVCEKQLPEAEWAYPKSIELPDTIRYIGYEAFGAHTYENEDSSVYGLTSVDLPASVMSISDDFLGGSRLVETITGLDAFDDEESSNPYRLADGTGRKTNEETEEIEETAVAVIVSVWDKNVLYTYPSGNTATEFVMPEGIEVIGYNAFRDAKNLTRVNLTAGNSLYKIFNDAFQNCDNLERVMIPASLRELEHGPFNGCNSLVAIDIPYGNDTFRMHEDGTLRMGEEWNTIAVLPGGNIPEGGIYRISDDVAEIKDGAAKGSNRLTELTIPANVEAVCNWAFANNSKLRKVTVEGDSKNFPIDIFAGCNSLETMEFTGESLELWYFSGDDVCVRESYDEEGNRFHVPFNLVVSETCDVNFFTVDDYDYDNGHHESIDVHDNPYFNLLRGTSETVYGDVNGDGEATEDDALYLLRHTILSDRYPLSEGDHNYDESEGGEITAKDAVALKNIISNQ